MKKKLIIVLSLILLTLPIFAGGEKEELGNGEEASVSNNTVETEDVNFKKTTADGTFKIGIASREIVNDFNRDIVNNAISVIESAGSTVVSTDAQADPQKHNENIESLINSGVDGLIVQLGDAQQLASIMAKAKSKGIPVITCAIGSPVQNTVTDINGDDALMTVMATNALLSSINYEGDVYIVWVPGAPLLETRKRIFEAIAKDFPDVTLHEVPSEHNAAKVQTSIEAIMTANPEPGSIAGIFGTYDLLVSGASEAIRRAGRGKDIKVVGIDGDRIGFQMLFQEDSPFVATVVQDVPSIGRQAGEIMLKILNGEIDASTVPPKTAANCYVATRKNGVEAAELRWTKSFWDDVELNKEEIKEMFPQTESVLVAYPVVP